MFRVFYLPSLHSVSLCAVINKCSFNFHKTIRFDIIFLISSTSGDGFLKKLFPCRLFFPLQFIKEEVTRSTFLWHEWFLHVHDIAVWHKLQFFNISLLEQGLLDNWIKRTFIQTNSFSTKPLRFGCHSVQMQVTMN